MKTVLILYENGGAGHKRTAELLASMLAAENSWRTVVVAGSELFDEKSVLLINWLWAFLVRKNWITLADWLLNFQLRAWILPLMEATGLAACFARLDDVKPDAIICTTDGYAKALGLYAEERLIPFYVVLTEFTVFADLANPAATHICYFPETINAIRSYCFEDAFFSERLSRTSSVSEKIRYVARVYRDRLAAGGARSIYRNIDRHYPEANQARCIAVGPIVDRAYYSHPGKHEMRKKLGISVDRPCALVVSGSIGGVFLYDVVTTIQDAWREPLTLIAVCGRDQKTYRKIAAGARRNAAVDVMPLGYRDAMVELYAAADVVIARPSASVLLEALMLRVPIMIPERATANDLGGAELIKRHHLGRVFGNHRDLLSSFDQLLQHHTAHVDAISDYLAAFPTDFDTLQKIIADIIRLPGEGECEVVGD